MRLNNVQNVRLNYMNITGNNHSGIYATTVNGFQLNRCNISNNGDATVSNPDEEGVSLYELTGSAIGGSNPTSITNCTISNNYEFEVHVTNTGGTLTDLTNVRQHHLQQRRHGCAGRPLQLPRPGLLQHEAHGHERHLHRQRALALPEPPMAFSPMRAALAA